MKVLGAIFIILFLSSCSSFKAERVDSEESDKKALQITDQWIQGDTERVIKKLVGQIRNKKNELAYFKTNKKPKIFIGEIQNYTPEAYFPINDLNDELLSEFSAGDDFVLVDAASREKILKEITYQNDGMVDPAQAKKIGKQAGADLMIFGNVYSQVSSKKGKTIKQYSVTIVLTEIETSVEIIRVRDKLSKFSEQSSTGW
jgi:penicillin-binding protein activator